LSAWGPGAGDGAVPGRVECVPRPAAPSAIDDVERRECRFPVAAWAWRGLDVGGARGNGQPANRRRLRVRFVDELRWPAEARAGETLPELMVNSRRPGLSRPRLSPDECADSIL
jgi:hypothetical protein